MQFFIRLQESTIVSLHRFFLYLFVGLIMIDPANRLLHMKEIAFGLLLLVTLCTNQWTLYKDALKPLLFLYVLAFLSICMGVLVFKTDYLDTIPYLKSLVFVLVLLPLSKWSADDIVKFNYYVGLGLSSFISILLLASVGGLINLTSMVMTLADAGAVYIAKREFLGIDSVMFFYASMPFCFFSFIYALRNKKIIQSFIILAPIVYGGSRTPMLMAFAMICYILYDRKSKWLKYALAATFVVAILYVLLLLTSSTYSDDGDSIKYAVAGYLFSHSSVWGHGVGAEYLDPARQEIVSSTEMTYVEMLYQYGWILFPFVIFVFSTI